MTEPLRGTSAERVGKTGLLGVAAVAVASVASAVVSAVREREGDA